MFSIKALPPPNFHDVRDKHKIYHGSNTKRDWQSIRGVVLHQTACFIGENIKNWYRVTCHIGITRKGQIIYNNDLRNPLWHGHGFNSDTVGIEIDGNFEGIKGVEYTWWKKGGGPAVLNDEQIDSAKNAIAWILNECFLNGGNLTHIYAHRQSSADRQADPGSSIWKEIGLWSSNMLLLKNNPAYKIGTGYPIPEEWDERSVWGWNGNMTKKGIRKIQVGLNSIGIAPELVIDGIWGLKTTKAIKIYQKRSGLVPDGTFGPKTWAYWNAELNGITIDNVDDEILKINDKKKIYRQKTREIINNDKK